MTTDQPCPAASKSGPEIQPTPAYESGYYREAAAHTVQTQPHACPDDELPRCAREGCGRPLADHDFGVFCP